MKRLILFAKRPRPGRVKTRLVPPLRTEQALELYRAFLRDQLRFLGSFAQHCAIELCGDGPWDATAHGEPPRGTEVFEQGSGDLGRRMLGAFRRSREAGNRATVIFSTDCPTLPEDRVRDAFQRLETGTPALTVPAEDGGYVLIGARDPLPELFRDIPWGGPSVLEVTRRRAEASGVALESLESWYDVDDAGDLVRLGRDLALARHRSRAPETALLLSDLARALPGVI